MALLVAITGPSGVGKSTVINGLLARHRDWSTVRSFTTRQPRLNENDSKRYHFVSDEEFARRRQNGDIVEAERFAGHRYGTSRSSLEAALGQAPVVMLDVQIRGVINLKKQYPDLISIFLTADFLELKERLAADARRRAVPAVEQQRRLAEFQKVSAFSDRCDFAVPNRPGQIEATVEMTEKIILERLAA